MSKAKTLMDFVKAAKSRIKEIDIEQVTELQSQGYGLLDVREYEEYEQGTLPGAINIPRGVIEALCDPSYPSHKKEMLDRDHPWLILCATSGRAAMVTDVMQQMGFKNVLNIVGGLAAWKEAEKQVVLPPKHHH
jgi:rhodanese-related sulfurtransferase